MSLKPIERTFIAILGSVFRVVAIFGFALTKWPSAGQSLKKITTIFD